MNRFHRFLLALVVLLFAKNTGAQEVSLRIDTDTANSHQISRHIYGHFAEHLGRCIYDGFWVSDTMKVEKVGRIRMDIVRALNKIKIPNLRWPGGCFADEYHWRDGIGAPIQRPKMVNTNWGGVTEDNSFGTHEFMKLCELLKTEPYIAANVGSGTVEEMAKWVEYFNFDGESPMARLRKQNGHAAPWKVSFWGVGNESWGCGGEMTAEFYADQYKRYATYARNYPGAPLKKIASGANTDDYHWTEVLMRDIGPKRMWGVTLHYYTLPNNSWPPKGSATSFSDKEYFNTMKNCLRMEELVTKHSAIMDKYDKDKAVALLVDEWGIWTEVEPGTNPGFLYQQNSMRDALIAGTTLNIFNNHSDRVRGANLAQSINVLQSLILTKGRQMVLTPTYHVFDLFKVHQDAKYLNLKFSSPSYSTADGSIPALNASASLDSANAMHITLVNIDPVNALQIKTSLGKFQSTKLTGSIVTSSKVTDINSFENPNLIGVKPFTGARKSGDELIITLPAKSVVMLELK
jgi:alpha-N-arabinofuranosidase